MPCGNTPARKIYLIVYASRLFPAHWALWIPNQGSTSTGKLVHVVGDSNTGFAHEFKRNYSLAHTRRTYSIHELAQVDPSYVRDVPGIARGFSFTDTTAVDLIEQTALSVPAPGPSLSSSSSSGSRRPPLQNCQTWMFSFVQALIMARIFPQEAYGLLQRAPRN